MKPETEQNHRLFNSYIQQVIQPSEVGIKEYGISRYRFDALFIKPHLRKSQRKIRIFEFKQSRADFKNDKKWPNYLQYCNSFAFVCPEELIQPDELPKGVGLVWLKPVSENHALASFKWKRRPKLTEVDPEIFHQILSGMLIRAKFRRNDII